MKASLIGLYSHLISTSMPLMFCLPAKISPATPGTMKKKKLIKSLEKHRGGWERESGRWRRESGEVTGGGMNNFISLALRSWCRARCLCPHTSKAAVIAAVWGPTSPVHLDWPVICYRPEQCSKTAGSSLSRPRSVWTWVLERQYAYWTNIRRWASHSTAAGATPGLHQLCCSCL